jgi:hypothetical protein
MLNEAGREMLNAGSGCFSSKSSSLVVLKTEGVIANRFFNVQPFRLFSSEYAKPVHPRTKNDQKVVERPETNSAVPPADIQIESSHDQNCFEKGNNDRPVKMLKQKAKENIAFNTGSKGIDTCQSEGPIRQL